MQKQQITQLSGKRVTVAGLGRFGGGIAVARWLCEQEARVLVTDREPADRLADSVAQLSDLNLEFRLGEHREADFVSSDLVVASPAVPPDNHFLQAAQRAGVPITTEICLFAERCPAQVFGVTGTKGKSTTAAMLGDMLRTQHQVWVGGNIGKSLLPELPRMQPSDQVVLELSSFMLEYLGRMRWRPHVAVVTLILADHLEWHKTREAYVQAKTNLVRFQEPGDFAILNGQDATSLGLARQTRAQVVYYGTGGPSFRLRVPGAHNQLNAQAAYAAASIAGIPFSEAQRAMAKFAGLPHRLELVCESEGVKYYNDSIATIPDAAIAALESFEPRRVIQIVGGYDKKLTVSALCQTLRQRAKAVLCIGATGADLETKLRNTERTDGAEIYHCGDLNTAVENARKIAAPGDVVLLSPGFASYDQFVNFEQRGNEFRRLVQGQ